MVDRPDEVIRREEVAREIVPGDDIDAITEIRTTPEPRVVEPAGAVPVAGHRPGYTPYVRVEQPQPGPFDLPSQVRELVLSKAGEVTSRVGSTAGSLLGRAWDLGSKVEDQISHITESAQSAVQEQVESTTPGGSVATLPAKEGFVASTVKWVMDHLTLISLALGGFAAMVAGLVVFLRSRRDEDEVETVEVTDVKADKADHLRTGASITGTRLPGIGRIPGLGVTTAAPIELDIRIEDTQVDHD